VKTDSKQHKLITHWLLFANLFGICSVPLFLGWYWCRCVAFAHLWDLFQVHINTESMLLTRCWGTSSWHANEAPNVWCWCCNIGVEQWRRVCQCRWIWGHMYQVCKPL